MTSLSMKLLVIAQIIFQRENKHNLQFSRNFWYESYDYIVVGAGTAGCVVAARLAEDRNITVLLLEAGGPQTAESDVPAKQSSLFGSNMDWNYPIVQQNYSYFSKIDQRMNIPRGKVFGGSSVLNGMNYYRESPEYFEMWDQFYGLKNWKYDDVLPYFLKSENNLDLNLVQKSNGYHRTGGPLSISTATDFILESYIKAAQLMEYNITYTDGRQPFGVTIMQRTIKDGIRQSASTAFIESNPKSNLHTVEYSHVTQILFDSNKKAIGVIFYRNGIYYEVRAEKEIILSAGVIGSPHLLMLSGIGPKDHLKSFNIPVISDLKVGYNLLYSINSMLYFDIKNQSLTDKPISSIDNLYKYYVEHSGPLSYKLSGVHCFREISHKTFSNLSNGCVLPRINFLDENLEKLVKNHKLKKEWEDFYRPYLGRAYLPLAILIRRPKSKGRISLKSNNPFDYPLIDPCILCDKSDIEVLVKTFKLSLAIYQSPYFQKFTQIYNRPIPGCKPCYGDYFCDQYLRCVSQTINGYIYPVGSCRMGSDSDNEAVVDNSFKVKGVKNLRVIDCSIIPITTEQTNAITTMIGERGAQCVKDDSL